MWGWLKPLLEVLLAFLERKSKEQGQLEDGKTPKTVRDGWAAYIRERLRDKGDNTGQK